MMLHKFSLVTLLFSFCFANAKETHIFSGVSYEEPYQILALGSALADYSVSISDQQLQEMGFQKGGWMAISEKDWNAFYEKAKVSSSLTLGGSALNVIKGLAHLGAKCACLGKIGSDGAAETFLQKLSELHVRSLLRKSPLSTGKVLCFITPDGQRTMRTFLGASQTLNDITFDHADFARIKIFHAEGYQLAEADLLYKAFALAKQAGAKISMDLGSAPLVKQYRKELEKILKEYVDIVFANEDEAAAFTGLEPMHACSYLAKLCETAVVTMGKNGGWVKKGKEHYYFPAIPVTVKDTTGAGDLFASGFLLGVLKERPLKECAWMGAYLASHIVCVVGTELPETAWQELRDRIKLEESLAKKADLSQGKETAKL